VKVWSGLFRDGAELLAFIVPRVAPQGAIAKWAGYRVTGEAPFAGSGQAVSAGSGVSSCA